MPLKVVLMFLIETKHIFILGLVLSEIMAEII